MATSIIKKHNTTYEELCDTNDLTVRVSKCMNVVTLYIKTKTAGFASKGAWTTLINLPQMYRPIYDVNTVIVDNAVNTSDKVAIVLRVTTNGNVNVWPYNDNSLPVGAVTYCVN